MRRFTLVFLVLLAVAACAKSPTAAPPKSDGDPYAIVGAAFAVGLYPDTARVTTYIHYSNGFIVNGQRSYVDSQIVSYIDQARVCNEIYTGSGFVDDNVITVDWIITARGTGDTLARYTTAPLDPLNSPLPGVGDDPQHVLRWSIKIDSLTPIAPALVAFTASAAPLGGNGWAGKNQSDYCAP